LAPPVPQPPPGPVSAGCRRWTVTCRWAVGGGRDSGAGGRRPSTAPATSTASSRLTGEALPA